MRSAVAALAAVVSLVILAAPAAADVRHAQLGDVSASLSLTTAGGGAYVDHLRLTVAQAGSTVYTGPVTTAGGRPGELRTTPRVHQFVDARLRVLDLDGDGTGEVVIDLAERGSYCCSHTVIVGERGGAWHPLELDWGSYGSAAAFARVADGTLLVARDARLEERYTPHVLSFEPVRILRYDRGIVRDVSKHQTAFVERDLSELLGQRRALLRRKEHATIDLRGLFAAIAGDRLLLGRRTAARRSLDAEVRAGNVRTSSGEGPIGAAFPPSLMRLLGRLGY